ncbi:MAG: tetratricopeptide repeat protein [Planctomycetia bacterium]|nr:tetratricopeptide repeat protein [Planctomycetia bacterium]
MRRLAAIALGLALAGCGRKAPPPPAGGPAPAPAPGPGIDTTALLKSGEDALRRGDPAAAARDFRAAADASPRDVGAWARWHEAMRADRKGDEAKSEFEKRLAAAPEDPQWLTLAALADRNGREDRLRKAIQKAPEFAWAHCALCETLVELKRYDEALRAADRALQLDPASGIFRLQKAVALMWLGKSAEALEEAGKAGAALPGDERVPIVRAQILMGEDRVDEAIASMEEAAKLAPAADAPKAVLRDWRLMAARRFLREFDEAFAGGRAGSAADAAQRAAALLEQVEAASPGDPDAARLLPQVETASAAALLKRAGDALKEGNDADASSFCERAQPWLAKAAGRALNESAREYLTQGWLRLGTLQLSLGDRLKDRGSPKAADRYREALASFEACLKADPANRTAPAMVAEAKKALEK